MPELTPFAAVVHAARAALLSAEDHEAVGRALQGVAAELGQGQENAKRALKLTDELTEMTVKLGKIAAHCFPAVLRASGDDALAEWVEEALEDATTKAAYDAELARFEAAASPKLAAVDAPESETGG